MREVITRDLPECGQANRTLARAFWRETAAPATRRSHFENGRYENIYPDMARLPEALPIIHWIREGLADMPDFAGVEGLSLSFWFNVMAPGDVTLAHRHDIADELLSGVYYLQAPPRSGDLVITAPAGPQTITPRPGLLVLFPSHWEHAVTPHRGRGIRLSMAFNAGLRAG